jgi:hypothetical protein
VELSSNEVVDLAAVNHSAWAAALSHTWSPPRLLFRRRSARWRQDLRSHVRTRAGHRRRSCDGKRLRRPRRGHGIKARFCQDDLSAVDTTRRLNGAPKRIEAEALKSDGAVTSVSVGGATAYIASGEMDVPPSALVS